MDFINDLKKKRARKKIVKNTREIKRFIRKIERDMGRIEQNEKKSIAKLKTVMTKRDETNIRILARDINCSRKDRDKLGSIKSQLNMILNRVNVPFFTFSNFHKNFYSFLKFLYKSLKNFNFLLKFGIKLRIIRFHAQKQDDGGHVRHGRSSQKRLEEPELGQQRVRH